MECREGKVMVSGLTNPEAEQADSFAYPTFVRRSMSGLGDTDETFRHCLCRLLLYNIIHYTITYNTA